jgi:hypothetical protein
MKFNPISMFGNFRLLNETPTEILKTLILNYLTNIKQNFNFSQKLKTVLILLYKLPRLNKILVSK